jgi:Putative porin
MRNKNNTGATAGRRQKKNTMLKKLGRWVVGGAGVLAATAAANGLCADAQDPLLDVLIKKGILSEQEAKDIKSEAEASQATNAPAFASKWKISDGIKSVELYGDMRMRYEYRSAQTPINERVSLERFRYAFRLGLRGDLANDFYYGFRLETSSNPRSPWATFGTSTSGNPYVGPFGKSTAGIDVGQIYIGWRPESWLDITIGKMPMPMFTTPMIWDSDINPEGAAEHFKFTVGDAELFANFGQFVYQDVNPVDSPSGFFPAFLNGTSGANTPFLLAWQAGVLYHLETNVTFKAAATLYNYTGHGVDSNAGNSASQGPGFKDIFVGEGAPTDINGVSKPGSNIGQFGSNPASSDGFYWNQTGINDLMIVDVPFEVTMRMAGLTTKLFGDVAENMEGANRAEAAAAVGGFSVQKNEKMAYQIGVSVGNGPTPGLVYGQVSKKGMWEARTYWQHVEQYALDPNLLDSDFFEGRGNLQGIYAAVAYGLSDNIITSLRGGYASRIDQNLGTGGSNQDIPQVNPINRYQILQVDLTYRF